MPRKVADGREMIAQYSDWHQYGGFGGKDLEEYDVYGNIRTQIVERRHTVFETENAIWVCEQQQETSINRRSGKRWYNWRTVETDKIFRTKNEQYANVRVVTQSRKHILSFGDNKYLWQRVYNVDSPKDPFIQHALRKFPINFMDIYPLAPEYNIRAFHRVPAGATFLKEKTVQDATIRLFGKRRYRKDLVKTIAESNIRAILLASQFRGYAPIDWIIHFLRINPTLMYEELRQVDANYRSLRKLLSLVPQNNIRRILYTPIQPQHLRALGDTLHSLRNDEYPANLDFTRRIRNLTELHDIFFAARRDEYRQANWNIIENQLQRGEAVGGRFTAARNPIEEVKDIQLNSLGEKLKDFSWGEYKILMPSSVNNLYEWSDFMNNCISSYHHSVTRKDPATTLGAVEKNGKLIANFEIEGYLRIYPTAEYKAEEGIPSVVSLGEMLRPEPKLKQLLGKYNNNLDDYDRGAIERIFKYHRVNIDNYWGKPGRLVDQFALNGGF